MKILYFSYGMAQYTLPFVHQIPREWEKHLFIGQDGPLEELSFFIKDDWIVKKFKRPKSQVSPENFKLLYKLLNYCKAHEIDIIHTNGYGFDLFPLVVPLLGKIKLVNTVHDASRHEGEPRLFSNFKSFIINNFSDRILVHSLWTKNQVSSRFKIKKEKIGFYPLHFDNLYFNYYNNSKSRKYILFVGRILKYKGIRFLLEIEKELFKFRNDYKLIIAGRGYDENLVNLNNSRIQLKNKYISNKELSNLFNESKICVLPYMEASQSGVIPMSYYFGVPVISSNIGGLSEQVLEGDTGFLFEHSTSPKKVASQINDFLSSKTLQKEFSAKSKLYYDKYLLNNVHNRNLKFFYLSMFKYPYNSMGFVSKIGNKIRRIFKRVLFGNAFDSKSLSIEMQKRAVRSTVDFLEQNCHDALPLDSKEDNLIHALNTSDRNGLYLEFGVYKGKSINFIADKIGNQKIHGFDSFEGLPEYWRRGMPKGTFSTKVPKCRKNVNLVVGEFKDTLPDFFSNNTEPISFAHIDCDLYNSTKEILNNISKFVKSGTVLVFDDFFNYYGWEKGEAKAFQEFISLSGKKFSYISYTVNSESLTVKFE